MNTLHNNAMSLGFTLEMIFRGADIDENGYIKLN